MNLDVFAPEWDEDPYPVYAHLRERHPVYFNDSSGSYLLSRFADVDRAFRDKALSSESYSWQTEPMLGDHTILTMEGREHSSYRALISPSFKGTTLVAKFMPMIAAEVDALVDGFRGEGRVDLVGQYSTDLPIAVVVAMLGLPKEDLGRFKAWNQATLDYLGNYTGDDAVAARCVASKAEMEAYLYPIIDERSCHPGDDLLSALCVSEVDGLRMTPSEVKAFICLLLVAGGETTGKALTSLFATFMERPDIMDEVRRDRTLVEAAIAESMRYSPPGHVILRQATEDTEFSGAVVPKDGIVMLMIGSANRDEQHYSEPDRFDIHRKDNEAHTAFAAAANHFGFGGGRHFCVGAMLAKMEIELSVNALFDAMTSIEPEGPLPPATGLFSRGRATLPLKFDAAR